MNVSSRTQLLAVLLGICCLGGCTQLDLKPDWDWYGNHRTKIPNSIVCLWKDAIRHKPGEPSMRGFGGRVYFYENNNPKPIKVDGQLIVYAFDDEGFDPRYGKAIKHFIFTEETFGEHHSESELGHSYSFFLPWDEIGGERENLALIARFEPKGGQLIMSDVSRMTLPGIVVAKTPRPAPAHVATQSHQAESAVRRVSYEPPVAASAKPRMQTATIDLPPGTFSGEGSPMVPEGMVPKRLPATDSARPLPTRAQGTPQTIPVPANAPIHNGHYYDVSPAGSSARAALPTAGQPAPAPAYPRARGTTPPISYPSTRANAPSPQAVPRDFPQGASNATATQAGQTATAGNWTTRVSYEPISWRDRAAQRPLSHSGPQRYRAPRLTANQPRFDHAVSQPGPSMSPYYPESPLPPAQATPISVYSPAAPQYQTPAAAPGVVYR